MTYRFWAAFVACSLAVVGPARAQETGLNLLRLGPDAAANAMGNAQVAASRDAFSTYWNPAGLAAATVNAAAVSHRIWVGDIRTYSVAARFRGGERSGFGLAVTAIDLGEFEERESPTSDPEGLFGAQSVDVGVSYGRQIGPVRAGVTARYLSEHFYEASASGYAFDAGAQLSLLDENLILGAALQHMGRMNDLVLESTTLPRTGRVGAAVSPFRVLAADDGERLLDVQVMGEVSHVFPSGDTRLHAGLGAQILDMLSARAGFITHDELLTATFGAGGQVASLRFDYAFLPFASGFGGSGHVLTLHYAW